jgi:hypothetical protein
LRGRRTSGATAAGPWGSILLAFLLASDLVRAPLLAQSLPGSNDFGRWQQSLSRCRLLRTLSGATPVSAAACRFVRLDQQMEGMLSVRFVNPAAGHLFLDHQLIFAGVLEAGSAAMRCRQSRCEPRWPLRLKVSAVGQTGLEAIEPTSPITRAQLATGHCLLEAGRFLCEADGPEGTHWRAEAEP